MKKMKQSFQIAFFSELIYELGYGSVPSLLYFPPEYEGRVIIDGEHRHNDSYGVAMESWPIIGSIRLDNVSRHEYNIMILKLSSKNL